MPPIAKIRIGKPAEDAAKPANPPEGRARLVEAAARNLHASLSAEGEARASALDADRIRTKNAAAKLAKGGERLAKAQILEQRRQRLAASVAAIEKKGEKQSPFNASHETRYCLARNAENKLAFITDSL
jgi:hypothetical protein